MSNKLTRRIFLKTATGFGATLAAVTSFPAIVTSKTKKFAQPGGKLPVLVCSRGEEWGKKTNGPGWEVLSNGGSLLDAVEKAANVTELDPEDTSVGYGGLPNEDGVVQLDASCMYGPAYKAGCVAALEGIKTPSSIARLVMERTDHIMIVGAGAQRFAIMHGFQVENLLTEKARMIWLKWKENHSDKDDWIPPADGIYKDRTGRTYGTINVLGVDEKGNIAGITTTSGLSNKISGRVGDSPIIGAGLYVDNEVGAAGATGRGEEVIRTCGSFYIVSLMRQGMTPTQACVEACKRIIEINKKLGVPVDFYDKFVAVNKKGEVGCASIAYPKDRKHEVAFTNPDGFTAMAGELVKA